MALVIADRVREFSSTTGTGTLTLSGAAVGYQDFATAIGVGNTCYYAIYNPATNEWEVGLGTVGSSTLARTSVLASSNSGSLVDFTAGSKDVFVTYPAAKSVYTDLAQTLTNKTMSGANNTFSNIGNSSLTNSSVTIGTTNVALGATTTTLSDVTLINPSFSGASFTDLSFSSTFTGTGTAVITSNSNTLPTLRLTQEGTAAAFVVEDSTNPDSTPFVVTGTGNVGLGNSGSSSIGFYNTKAITGSTTAYADYTNAEVQSDVTSAAYGYRSALGTQAASFTLGTLAHFSTVQSTFGAGSTVTNQYGFQVSSSLTGATNNYGFYGNIAGNADVAISSISRVGTTVTANTSTAHGLTAGDQVSVNSVADNTYNGIYTVISAPTTTQFTYDTTTSSTGSSSGGYSNRYSVWNVYTSTAPSYFSGPVIMTSANAAPALRITQTGTGNALVVEDSANPDSTPFVVDASGQVIKGSLVATTFQGSVVPAMQLNGTNSFSSSTLGAASWGTTQNAGLYIARSNGGANQVHGIVSSGDNLGIIDFAGSDGTNFIRAANINAYVDGTPGTNDMPGRLVFSTTSDGASSPTERMRIDNAGRVGIGGSAGSGNTLRITGNFTGGTSPAFAQASPNLTATQTGGSHVFYTTPTADADYAGTSLYHFSAVQGTFTAGATLTNQFGFNAASSLTGATNNYGFYSAIASGTGRWNFYAAGAADNYFVGRVLIGLNTDPTTLGSNAGLILNSASTSQHNIAQIRGNSDANGPTHYLAKSKGSGNVLVANNDVLGNIVFRGNDGADFLNAAGIQAFVDGTPNTNDMPGRLVFSTTADGGSTLTERLRIDSAGRIGIGTTSPATLLHVSSATGSATPTPTEVRIATTTSAADWSTTSPWGRLSFYSADLSSGGPKIQAAIDAVAQTTAGANANLSFKTSTNAADSLTERMRIVNTGSSSPAYLSLENSTGLSIAQTNVTAPAASDGNVFSGTYTPTQVSTNTNVTSVTFNESQYMRVGNVVTVSGRLGINATATGNTVVKMSFPIASTTTSTVQCGGTAVYASSTIANNTFVSITTDTTNDCVQIQGNSTITGTTANFFFTFTYLVV